LRNLEKLFPVTFILHISFQTENNLRAFRPLLVMTWGSGSIIKVLPTFQAINLSKEPLRPLVTLEYQAPQVYFSLEKAGRNSRYWTPLKTV